VLLANLMKNTFFSAFFQAIKMLHLQLLIRHGLVHLVAEKEKEGLDSEV
jgi:hypothetical protein